VITVGDLADDPYTWRKEPRLRRLSELPNGVVGIEASGKLAAEDYRDVVLPVVEKKLPPPAI
jgi:hypothetical protein